MRGELPVTAVLLLLLASCTSSEMRGEPEHREGLGVSVFREDDAYTVLYPSGPVYRRFTVVD